MTTVEKQAILKEHFWTILKRDIKMQVCEACTGILVAAVICATLI